MNIFAPGLAVSSVVVLGKSAKLVYFYVYFAPILKLLRNLRSRDIKFMVHRLVPAFVEGIAL